MKTTISLMLLAFFLHSLPGQDHSSDTLSEHGSASHNRHTVAAGFGFTFIPVAGGLGDTQARGLFVPSVGLDYFFHLGKHWELGFMADYELDHYMIVDKQIEREHAFLLVLTGMYKFGKYWGAFAGGGVELEPHHHLAVLRLGMEYDIHLRGDWAIVPKIYFDFKENYNTWSFQVSLARHF